MPPTWPGSAAEELANQLAALAPPLAPLARAGAGALEDGLEAARRLLAGGDGSEGVLGRAAEESEVRCGGRGEACA